MKYLEYISHWKYSKLWIIHSVLIKDNKVWSWEFQYPLISKWKFHIYDIKEWKNDIKEEIRTFKIKDFDLEPYRYIEIRWINCVEILDKIVRENKAWIIIPLQFYIYRRLNFAFLWIFVTLILMISTFLYWYYWFSYSEEEFLEINDELCQE